uniref:Uncharacterized protein n=1 Tax=Rhizophora mucronata TaxID=61149 RepID=A0A2P2M1T3_RHIMU
MPLIYITILFDQFLFSSFGCTTSLHFRLAYIPTDKPSHYVFLQVFISSLCLPFFERGGLHSREKIGLCSASNRTAHVIHPF